MYDRTIKKMRENIRIRKYVMTLHAEEEMVDDSLVERQKDKSTKEWKYIIEGETISLDMVVVVAKLGITGKLIIVIVYKM